MQRAVSVVTGSMRTPTDVSSRAQLAAPASAVSEESRTGAVSFGGLDPSRSTSELSAGRLPASATSSGLSWARQPAIASGQSSVEVGQRDMVCER